jgi:PBSX family phage terminase large subunit
MIQSSDIAQLIAPCYYPLHRNIREGRYQYYNLPGGRGSAKSSFCALEIVFNLMRDSTGRSNAIVFRRVDRTLRESVFSQISWAIDALGVNSLWESKLVPLQHVFKPTGASITYRGLDDPLKLKSIKPKKGVFNFIWFEEFSEIDSEVLLRSVQQSVIRGDADHFTVFRSFNPPISKANWANQFVQIPDDRAVTFLTDYTMIPPEWLGEAFISEAERLREVNPQAYEHEFLGHATGHGGEVFPNIEVRTITNAEIEKMQYFFSGLDFGFSVDPAAYVLLSYDRKTETIYFIDEIYRRHMGNDEMAAEILQRGYIHQHAEVICDCAEPKSIQDMKNNGVWSATGCYKRAGCVQYRIKWMQHRKLVIDPMRTPNAHREFINYSYPVDKNGNLESRLEDRDNHSIDATGYALDRVIFHGQYSA